jgi:methionyl aminopeptidase
MQPGMVFTIEPMINAGKFASKLDKDHWTARTKDGSLSAQFEHTILVTETGSEILTKTD